jgi:hypothetical protein
MVQHLFKSLFCRKRHLRLLEKRPPENAEGVFLWFWPEGCSKTPVKSEKQIIVGGIAIREI